MRVDLVSVQRAGMAGATPSLLAEWRVGAVLQAVAVRSATTGQLWLELGGQRYPARVASGEGEGPQDGEQLQVRVLRNSPVLALETLSSRTPAAAASEGGAIADALRRYVPRQESPAPMLANLAWLAQDQPEASDLPKAVLQAASRLWQALPDVEAVTNPKSLEAALTRSGVFLEANLASARPTAPPPPLANDLKALLLSLSETLRQHGARPASARADAAVNAPLPTAGGALSSLPTAPATFAMLDEAGPRMNELAKQTDGAIARLTSTQIANSTQDSTVQSMLIELPIRQEDRASMLRLRVTRDGSHRRNGSGLDTWSVEAAMDLGAIGALHARVTLTGDTVGVQLRAESAGVVEALAARTGELEAILREAGLDVDRVVCLHGMPASDPGLRPTRLLDLRA